MRPYVNLLKEIVMLTPSSVPDHSTLPLAPSMQIPEFGTAHGQQIIVPRDQTQALTFKHSVDIYLKESNAYGNTYFARYFEWQGICRERWFFKCISADMLQKDGVFITKRAHQDYAQETFPFQTVQCEVNTFDVKACSFYLLFRFKVDDTVVSTGYQQIVFASHDKRIKRLPARILEMIRLYEVSHAEIPL
jgi:enediyne core biosynthesis thioesterase